MNIFVLDENVKKCAQYHCDQHVVKMILESAQMLCTALKEFAQAMPDQYKVPGDPVKAYRQFYLGEKMGFAKWTRRKLPYWVPKRGLA